MTNLDLRQLRYFIAVAEELHFGRAAQRLHISQPPLSQRIAALETELGVQLFRRTKHKVEITTAGVQLLKDARIVLEETKKAARRAQAAAKGQIGTLNIGLNYTSPLCPQLASTLYRFSKLYPQIGLELHENTSAKQLDRLYNGTLDICFVWPTREDVSPQIALHPMGKDVLNIVMRTDHPLAKKRNITADDLRDFPVFLTPRQMRTPFYDALTTACKKADFNPDVQTHIYQLPFILNFIVTGFGITFLPEFLKRIRPPKTLFRPCQFLPQRACMMPLTLAHRANDLSPLVQNFVKAAILDE